MQRLWVTGYRNFELNTFGDKDPKIEVIKFALKERLITLLENDRLDWLITGANLGVDQWACEVALELREKYPLQISIIVPYEEFAHRWNENHQKEFAKLQSKVDFFASTSNKPYQSSVQLRNYQNFMLMHTDEALMVYDPDHLGKPKFDYELIKQYQVNKDYPLELIDFYDLQDAAEEFQSKQKDNYFEK